MMRIRTNNGRPTAYAAAFLALTALVAGCGQKSEAPATSGGTPTSTATATDGKVLKIAVIPKGTSHEYWKSIHAGANKAQQDLAKTGTNIEIIWKGPIREDDRNGQVDVVQTFISQQVAGIVLAPLDNQAMVAPVHDATSAKIPVVIIDSSLNSKDYVSYVATDNHKGGELGAQQLAKALAGKKRILMLPYAQGSASTEQREAGFIDGIKKAIPGVQILSQNQYGGATVETCSKAAQNLISRYGSQIDGVFASNETTTRGMLLALKEAGLVGKVKFVGFDSSEDLVDALKKKQIDGLVVQNPFKMGEEGVTTLVNSIQGKKFEANVDTGVAIVTPENMETPEMKALLNPPLDQYLK